MAVVMASLFSLFNTMLGLKVVSWSRAAAEDVFRLLVSCGLVVIVMGILEHAFIPGQYLPVSFKYVAGLVVLLCFVAVRYRLRLVTGLASRWISMRQDGFGSGEMVLVVRAGEGSEFATLILHSSDFRRSYRLVGIADDDPAKQGLRFDGHKVLETIADIPELVRSHDIGVIFYAITHISGADQQRILDTCATTWQVCWPRRKKREGIRT